MPDRQIHPIGVVSAPGDYRIPDSAELRLKNAYAKFDGSGAAGSFLPLLRIISDAGTTLVEAVSDTEIAAGASADASWFPRVGGGGGSGAGSAIPSVYARRFGAFRFLPGTSVFSFGNGTQITNDPSVFSIDVPTARLKAAHGGLFLTTVFIAFSTTAGTPYAGQFELTTSTLDANNVSVESLTTPEIDYSELYATAGGDFFQLNGFGLVNGDDTFYTPPYRFAYTVTNDTDITATACSYGVTILNPLGLT